MSTVTVEVFLVEEHFNHVCQATIPEYWRAEVVCGKSEGLYADGDSRSEALDSLQNELPPSTKVKLLEPRKRAASDSTASLIRAVNNEIRI